MTEGRKRKLSDSLPEDPPPYEHGELPAKLANKSPLVGAATVSESAISAEATGSPTTPDLPRQENDESAVSAAEVLANLAHSPGPADSNPDSSITSPMSTTSLTDLERQQHPIVSSVSAVSKLPIVTNAVKYYEDSKRNYAPFNYAAGIVEKAAMPVFSKIEVNLNSMHQAKLHEARRQKKRRVVSPTEKTETKKRLKFCLHILKLANRQINDRVNCLQRAIQPDSPVSDRHQEQLSTPQSEEKHDDTHVLTRPEARSETDLTAVNSSRSEYSADPQETQTEIVTTVKKIIHVISNFRPSSLVADKGPGGEGLESEDYRLKSTIREIILNLPNQVQTNAASSSQTNDKIVTFAKESLNMIGRLTTVFNNQLEKAESWVDGEETAGEENDEGEIQPSSHQVHDEKSSTSHEERPVKTETRDVVQQ
ncbi:hypothetical protein FT663_04406 [Candidozyma haemuli var. vulneris]|uniref:Uncharacterized protein n=1 Tax=Candidozyma haemuli TaxID=45357 RepID=A0A2V1B008_9ASCO|nr:hypothetical protein CXQ85_002833 [[Candida] haemuloni]KAF3987529.1 hypothetical protein FT663_04406 [[Candida] haemuloni var. vulneris]KAF3990992.1 hypothetical protein FT662_01928 [[Candida] haemuloni var. vulneris]PVH23106.1 hypothetical protein CXQ85_002833 [[Candida] haemuloni]